ncbi:MAG: HAD-IIB family hydrolase [Atopobiaceae bacterium]|nr:HAD-IIB family hydrolase [Atopobiaceae bacterium]
MANKAFASDFDGTIWFNKDGQWYYHPEDFQAIREFQQAGGLFGISTGRSLVGVESAMERIMPPQDIVHFDFFILANGASVLDANHDTIAKTFMDKATIMKLYERYLPESKIVINANGTVYTLQEPLTNQTKISSFDELEGELFGISFWCEDPSVAARIAAEINRDMPDVALAHQNRWTVDVVGPGCTKGNAVEIVRKHYSLDRIAGVGDSFNDLPMLKSADVAFTFAHAPEELQSHADYVVDKVSDAIALFQSE